MSGPSACTVIRLAVENLEVFAVKITWDETPAEQRVKSEKDQRENTVRGGKAKTDRKTEETEKEAQ